MKVVIDELKDKGLRDKYIVLVGGAPLNEEFGKAVGADAYCRDAAVAAETAQALVLASAGARAAWRLMAELTVIRWRDIPMQVVARGDGATSARALLSDRFQEAVDASAMVAGSDRLRRLHGEMGWTGARAATTSRRRSRPRPTRLEADGPTRSCAPRSAPAACAAGSRAVTDTVVSSATREVVIGVGRPFVIIGERINPTGPAEARRRDEGRRLLDRDRRHARAGRGGRAHAGRERRHPARRRARDPRGRRSAWSSRSPTCRCRSTPRSWRRWRPAWPRTRASRS